MGFYSEYLDRFLERFSRNQFLVLSGDELRVDPYRVMTKVQEMFSYIFSKFLENFRTIKKTTKDVHGPTIMPKRREFSF